MVGFGQHLMVDGYGCNPQKLQDINLIYGLLEELPENIDMHKIMPPYVFRYEGLKPEDWGISGFVLIAESHISIHTFPEKGYLSLDIFSCKKFEMEKAMSYVKEAFEIKTFEKNLLNRGLEFPKDIGMSRRVVTKDRIRVIDGGKVEACY
ncbi:MAG: adenosylmethionine decarboxylase [Candidatus Schekmanbacteria bacterium]|nr:adenosylmethionine decarboxylase [Candidatus Schekmanbacteria bacterium]